jgi:hypothetical protein
VLGFDNVVRNSSFPAASFQDHRLGYKTEAVLSKIRGVLLKQRIRRTSNMWRIAAALDECAGSLIKNALCFVYAKDRSGLAALSGEDEGNKRG